MTVEIADLLFSVNLLAAMIWTGGLFAVAVATAAARQTLAPDEQVRFFRALGRRYGVVAGLALIVFAITGAISAGAPNSWTSSEATVAILTVAVSALTVVGVRNARAVQRLRAAALQRGNAEDDGPLRRARRTANAVRGLIALATLAALVVATV
ncbi:hypothetical protein BH10ACT11_BH10ACT11_18460 [soil metagenome]